MLSPLWLQISKRPRPEVSVSNACFSSALPTSNPTSLTLKHHNIFVLRVALEIIQYSVHGGRNRKPLEVTSLAYSCPENWWQKQIGVQPPDVHASALSPKPCVSWSRPLSLLSSTILFWKTHDERADFSKLHS
uniref:cDNA FLJ34594 fis, clone KIDNE2009109 n=1 Tax=Homo sapiens TaxID=9606 RepID=Q8NAX6_HUMAN|nr:unnamed protein product [Homo sapiens]